MKDTVSGKCLALFTGSKHLDVVTQVGATPELRNCADVSVGQDQRDTANERNTQKWQIRADKDGKYTISPPLAPSLSSRLTWSATTRCSRSPATWACPPPWTPRP